MPKFLIPVEMFPGVYRHGVGFFRPGDEIELPDAASQEGDVVSLRLVPLDDDAHALLLANAKAQVERERQVLAELLPPKKLTPGREKQILAQVKSIPADVLKAKAEAAGAKPKKDTLTIQEAAAGAGLNTASSGRAADK
jgi:hypothetical protein